MTAYKPVLLLHVRIRFSPVSRFPNENGLATCSCESVKMTGVVDGMPR